MDMYNTDPINGDDMLKDVDIEAFEAGIEQQAKESGFTENAGQYLAAMAMETKAFTEITEDFELRNYEILNQNGEPLSPQDVQLMDGKKMSVKAVVFDEIVANQNGATISGTNLENLTYVCGVGSNVLYFTGTVKNECNEETILTGMNLNGTVLDMMN